MCTAVTYRTRDHYFGRNLDYERTFGEEIVITPRHFPLVFRRLANLESHFAMIGMAHVARGCPLYYEATNERGLSMAGLNFPGNAVYHPGRPRMDNVTPYELIPWILGQCGCVGQARELLGRVNVLEEAFSAELPLTPLHWLLADQEEAVVVEPVTEGLKVWKDPAGVLTNSPTFDYHMTRLREFLNLTPKEPENRFAAGLELTPYSRGMGAMGMPGDWSSASRFVRAAFVRSNSVSGETEEESVSQFFHILGSVAQIRGCVEVENGGLERTIYSSCCNVDRGIYYYTTYENRAVTAVEMGKENLDTRELIRIPMAVQSDILRVN